MWMCLLFLQMNWWEPQPRITNTWLGLSSDHFYLTILSLGLEALSLCTIYVSASIVLEGFSSQLTPVNLALKCFSLWNLLLGKFTLSSSFWTCLASSTQVLWFKLLSKLTDSNWLLIFWCLSFLWLTQSLSATCLCKTVLVKLPPNSRNWIAMNWAPLHCLSTEWTPKGLTLPLCCS